MQDSLEVSIRCFHEVKEPGLRYQVHLGLRTSPTAYGPFGRSGSRDCQSAKREQGFGKSLAAAIS